jgi:gamma-D-glutamyl-L-lysine dipeptidyl-peptidase
MKYGICTLSVIPVRKDASDKSEMTTQLLFGDMVEFLDKSNQWLLIKDLFDNYEGWIDNKQITELSDEEYHKLIKASQYKVNELTFPVGNKTSNTEINALIGSFIPFQKSNSFTAGGNTFTFNRKETDDKPSIINIAMMYLNSPYLWGGKTPFGIDCSGFTQIVFKLNDINLLRDAFQQAEQGETIDFISEAKPGDLAFFDNNKGKIIHTGIILEHNKIIHASGNVRLDNIDHEGIFNEKSQQYTHKLRLIKRMS